MGTMVTRDDNLAIFDRWKRPASLLGLWEGCSAFMVCGGPSLNDLDTGRLSERGVLSLGVNNVCGWVRTTAMVTGDPPCKFHASLWRDPGLLKFVPVQKIGRRGNKHCIWEKTPEGVWRNTKKKLQDMPSVYAFERRSWFTPESFLTEPQAAWGNHNEGVARTGRKKGVSTMLLGLRLLHYLGAARVYLLGVDLGMDASRGMHGNYAFGETRTASDCQHNNEQYVVLNDMLSEMRPVLEAGGMEVFNCNRVSGCRAFDYVRFDMALEDCRNGVGPEPFDLDGWYEPVQGREEQEE